MSVYQRRREPAGNSGGNVLLSAVLSGFKAWDTYLLRQPGSAAIVFFAITAVVALLSNLLKISYAGRDPVSNRCIFISSKGDLLQGMRRILINSIKIYNSYR